MGNVITGKSGAGDRKQPWWGSVVHAVCDSQLGFWEVNQLLEQWASSEALLLSHCKEYFHLTPCARMFKARTAKVFFQLRYCLLLRDWKLQIFQGMKGIKEGMSAWVAVELALPWWLPTQCTSSFAPNHLFLVDQLVYPMWKLKSSWWGRLHSQNCPHNQCGCGLCKVSPFCPTVSTLSLGVLCSSTFSVFTTQCCLPEIKLSCLWVVVRPLSPNSLFSLGLLRTASTTAVVQKDGLRMKRPKTSQILSRFHSSGGSRQMTWQLGTVWKCCSELCRSAYQKLNTKNSGATPYKCASSILPLLRRSSLAHLSYSK